MNPKIVSERLGHASVAFTLDTYGHVLPGQQADAAAAVAALLDGEPLRDAGEAAWPVGMASCCAMQEKRPGGLFWSPRQASRSCGNPLRW